MVINRYGPSIFEHLAKRYKMIVIHFCISTTEELSGVSQKLAYWLFDSAFTQGKSLRLAPIFPIEKITLCWGLLYLTSVSETDHISSSIHLK